MDLPPLGELELAVLDHLWRRSTAETRDIHAAIGEARGITLSTIQSTVERLHRKKLVLRERVGHAYHYAPAVARDTFRARAIAQAAGDLKGAEAAGVIAAFVEIAASADKRNLDRLEAQLRLCRARRGTR